MQLILDMGSGNTCRNDLEIGVRMLDAVKTRGPGHGVVLKWQIFDKAGDNIPLDRGMFASMYEEAERLGMRTTASVFDEGSLEFLVTQFPDIPFVKIAAREDLYWLIGKVPEDIPVVASVAPGVRWPKRANGEIHHLMCVPEYPAKITTYVEAWKGYAVRGISDHTVGWRFFQDGASTVRLWEKHFCLEDSTGPDAGPFAARPKDLEEIRDKYWHLLAL